MEHLLQHSVSLLVWDKKHVLELFSLVNWPETIVYCVYGTTLGKMENSQTIRVFNFSFKQGGQIVKVATKVNPKVLILVR